MPTRPDHVDWAVPRWWVPETGAQTAISRETLIARWVAQPPPPNDGTFRDALHSWCSDATGPQWIRDSYRPAVLQIKARRTLVLDEVDGWNDLTALLADYLDTFARCSVSFTKDVRGRKPKVTGSFLPGRKAGTKQALSEQLTAAARTPVATAVRRAMIDDTLCGGVLESRDAADLFVSDPGPFRLPIRAAAMCAYGEQLLSYAAKLDDPARFGDSTREAVDALYRAASVIEDEFGELTRPPRRLSEDEKATVSRYLHQWWPRWLAGEDSTGDGSVTKELRRGNDIQVPAYDRVARALHKKLAAGVVEFVVSDTDVSVATDEQRSIAAGIFWSSVKFATWDLRKARADEARRTKTEVELDPDRGPAVDPADDEVVCRAIAAVEPAGYSTAALVLDGAAHYLTETDDLDLTSADPGYRGPLPCWEKTVAIELLTVAIDRLTELLDPDMNGGDRALEAEIAERRRIENPTNAMESTPAASGRLTRRLVVEATAAAADRHRRRTATRRTTDAINAYDRARTSRETELS